MRRCHRHSIKPRIKKWESSQGSMPKNPPKTSRLILNQGPVADRIPVLQAIDIDRFIKDVETQNKIIDFQEKVIVKLDALHPTFLQNLKKAVASKNTYRIQRILEEGNEMITTIATELSQIEKARQQAVAIQTDVTEASTDDVETLTAEAIDKHLWDLLPVCLLRGCIPDKIVIQKFEMPEEGLFREKLVSEVANL